MTSITLKPSQQVQYVLRLADTALILAQRLSEWCGHAPALEEDIALTNMSLDLVGQSRALLTHAGQLHAQAGGKAFDEDQLAFAGFLGLPIAVGLSSKSMWTPWNTKRRL